MPEIRKKTQLRSDDDKFCKISAKSTDFEISYLGLEFQDSSLGFEMFDEVSASKFWPHLGLEVYGLDYISAH